MLHTSEHQPSYQIKGKVIIEKETKQQSNAATETVTQMCLFTQVNSHV